MEHRRDRGRDCPGSRIPCLTKRRIADTRAATYPTSAIANDSHLIGNVRQMDSDVSQIARRCERAVITAYRDLRELGSDDLAAFQSCTKIGRASCRERVE